MLQSSQSSAEEPAAFYRFYLLQADDHIARRREDYFADDGAAISATRNVIGDFAGIEVWCGSRKVVTLSRAEVAHLKPPRTVPRATILIERNHVLLVQAQTAREWSAALVPVGNTLLRHWRNNSRSLVRR